MDAANVDLKAFTERFYEKRCAGKLEPVLETLKYLVHETSVWTEITTLLIPGENDGDDELDALTQWVAKELGPDVPLHFTAFHPDYRMLDMPPTPIATLRRARTIALGNGLHHVYVGNVQRSGARSDPLPDLRNALHRRATATRSPNIGSTPKAAARAAAPKWPACSRPARATGARDACRWRSSVTPREA